MSGTEDKKKQEKKPKEDYSKSAKECLKAAIPSAAIGYATGGPIGAARFGTSACIKSMIRNGF